MPSTERITVTLPAELIARIDHFESNRSRLVLQAVTREVTRREQEQLQLSLNNPHSESAELSEQGFDDWADSLREEDSELVDLSEGQPLRWVEGSGWVAA